MIKKLRTAWGNLMSPSDKETIIKVNELVDYVNDNPVPTVDYKLYVATLNQSGTTAPVASNIKANTLTDTPAFYYDAVGRFRVASDDFGNLSDGKVFVICGGANQNDSAKSLDCYNTTAPLDRDPLTEKCEIALETMNGAVMTNGLMYETQIEIRVY